MTEQSNEISVNQETKKGHKHLTVVGLTYDVVCITQTLHFIIFRIVVSGCGDDGDDDE